MEGFDTTKRYFALKLKDITPEDAKLIFAYRTCLAKFSEHLCGPHGPKLCPLCLSHLDNQQMAFNCPVIKPRLDEKGKYLEAKYPVKQSKT